MRCKLTFRANYANFNLGQWAVVSTSKGGAQGVEGGICIPNPKAGGYL